VKGALMSETFYTSCADVLALFQAQKDNLESLLDPQAGFAPRLRQLCEQQCVLPSQPPIPESFPLIHTLDWRTSAKREMRRQRRWRHLGWNAVHGHFFKQSCRASNRPLLDPVKPTDPSIHPPIHHAHPNNSCFFPPYPAHEKPNPHCNHRPALSFPRIPTPQPQPSHKQRWRPPARCRSS
jgi:hypothetical protein